MNVLDDKEYKEKRDFSKTSEPKGENKEKQENAVFVIQKHDASQLHYDFRLEIDGSLQSWAVPKGPSTDPSEKRLAIQTEAHPLEYADFEGVIPEDEYGGGTVMIWDKGTFKNMKKTKDGEPMDLKKCFDEGTIEIWLEGEIIKGGYALVEIKSGERKGKWLLIKMDDGKADARRNPVSTEKKSVETGRSLKEINKKVTEG